MVSFLTASLSPTQVAVRSHHSQTVVSSPIVSLRVSEQDGVFEIAMGSSRVRIRAVAEVRLESGSTRTTAQAATRKVSHKRVHDSFGKGVMLSVVNQFGDGLELKQQFWLYEGLPEVILRLEARSPSEAGANYMGPLVSVAPIAFPADNKLSCLHVPYDNDSYARFSSQGWDAPSYEVGALYDDLSRNGLIVGSIDHDLWKSAVKFTKDLSLTAFAGAATEQTRDRVSHGFVRGKTVSSPRFVIGLHDDWRQGMERFGDLNAKVSPPMKWQGSVPFGWNSWSGHKSKLKAKDANAAIDFIVEDLPLFRSGATAYVNLDSYWDNLSREELVAFVRRAHASGLKAGIYWTPFAHWGELEWGVGKQEYKYSDLAVKDLNGKPLPRLSGGFPLDPTHPGTLKRIDQFMQDFVGLGFDFIKLDFLTHGALEGDHYDPKITTGTAAYRVGMTRLLKHVSAESIKRPFFVALSIAPIFPAGFGHSRRISCDVFANIGASEYLLNSKNYGWWMSGRLYQYNDPDHSSVYQPEGEEPVSEAEARTRVTASVISGGKLMLGDDLGNPLARRRSRQVFSNFEILALAHLSPSFRPVNGETGTGAGDLFVWTAQGGKVAYVAAFNFEKTKKKTLAVQLARLGLEGKWSTYNVWTKEEGSASEELRFSLDPMDCALLRMTLE